MTSAKKDTSPERAPRHWVFIRIAYTGKGPPGPQLLSKRTSLEVGLEADGVGTVSSGEACHGYADTHVRTTDPEHTKTRAVHHLNRLHLAARARLYTNRMRCRRCKGSGVEPCATCNGSGRGGASNATCGACMGAGNVDKKCAECRGATMVPTS
jgi:hypothetical protein